MKRKLPVLWLLRRSRRRLPALLLMSGAHVCHALLMVAFALGTRNVINTAVSGERADFTRACLLQGLIILGILLSLLLYRFLRDRLLMVLDRDWKKDLLHGLLHGEYTAVSGIHSGELLNRMNNDVRSVNEGLLSVLPGAAAMAVRITAALAALAALQPGFALLIALLGGAALLAMAFLRLHLKRLHRQVSEQDGRVSGFLQESMEKLLMVQAMDVAEEMEHRAEGLLEQRYQTQRRRRKAALAANSGLSLLSYGSAFLALLWCSMELLQGRISFGDLTAITQLVSQLKAPVVGLSGLMPQYAAMLASAERLMELEAIPAEAEPTGEEARELYRRMTAIRGEGISFSYDRDAVLRQADFCLPKGSFAVVSGASGIGKSTLLKLLLGIYRPEEGELYLDCGDARIPVDRSLRRLFAYVPQGNLLLSGSIRENLTLVRPEATAEEIQQAVSVSAMDEFLPQLPQGLDTPIGENGAGLSEGQAQRLAIARAVLGGAPILLLDECTSALDARTEETVLQRLRALPDRSCIAVTHRPAALALCDHVLEFADGKILSHVREE